MTAEQVRAEREAREADARQRASALPPGDYYASGADVVDRATRQPVLTCKDHSDAVRVMLAAPRL